MGLTRQHQSSGWNEATISQLITDTKGQWWKQATYA